MPSPRSHLVLVLASPLVLLLAWDGATRFGLVEPILLPPPATIGTALWDVLTRGYAGVSVFVHVGTSLARVLTAFLLAALVGVSLGLLRGLYPRIDAVCLVPFELIRPIPPLAFIPLFILWFGIGEVSKVLIIFYYAMLVVMLNTQAGVASCPEDKIRAARSLGASPWQVFWRVVFPASLPHVVVGLRVALAAALSILVASELLGGDRGLGFVISDASTFFKTADVFVGIVLIGLIGLVADRALTFTARRIVHWEGKT